MHIGAPKALSHMSLHKWEKSVRCVQVLRGYIGDRSAKPVFEGATPFNVLGGGYQRPFELATLRLSNMMGILPKCECTTPEAPKWTLVLPLERECTTERQLQASG